MKLARSTSNKLLKSKRPAPVSSCVRLRYSSVQEAGILRKGRPGAFFYVNARGKRIKEAATLARIQNLVIPPAWQDVWICAHANGHLQAVGIDARGRKQYRYHPRWRETRDQTKYQWLMQFGALLPRIRRRVRRDIQPLRPRRLQVLAAIVRLLDVTGMRIGNEEYARTNQSFGLTTLRDRHVKVNGDELHFRFVGKSGIEHETTLSDRRLSRLVKQCRDIPGHELFQYRDERGRRRKIGSGDVNAYLQEITGQEVTAKDFRTWRGSVLAAELLTKNTIPESKSKRKRLLVDIVKQVAVELGNTPAICKKCYIHPIVFQALESDPNAAVRDEPPKACKTVRGLGGAEAAFLSLLEREKMSNNLD